MRLSGGTHLSPVLKGELQVCLAHKEGKLGEAPAQGPRRAKSLVCSEDHTVQGSGGQG